MVDLEDEVPAPSRSGAWRTIALTTLQIVPPVISVGCAIMAGYFTYVTSNTKPPADMAALAMSIMKSGDASPELRDWAADVLGIQTDIGMPAKTAQQ
ncbi:MULTISPECIES: hypothetical protein [unclassified Mesorhizobium]|uniref:hypothetical protein n=1 Tax=unclassified Mesorhizobium TaxID=325217 RepID=UPI00115F2CA8|nr:MULTISPECIES: hypothetical protein [unclassified Mesorhizobium]TRC90874.1 hypothetical protein FJV77_27630 [Mesorhizobium sp. WSM4306]